MSTIQSRSVAGHWGIRASPWTSFPRKHVTPSSSPSDVPSHFSERRAHLPSADKIANIAHQKALCAVVLQISRTALFFYAIGYLFIMYFLYDYNNSNNNNNNNNNNGLGCHCLRHLCRKTHWRHCHRGRCMKHAWSLIYASDFVRVCF